MHIIGLKASVLYRFKTLNAISHIFDWCTYIVHDACTFVYQYYFNEELDEVAQISIKCKSRVKSKC